MGLMKRSDVRWAAFEGSVFSTGAVMRRDDNGAKMTAVHALQSKLDYLLRALEAEDEED